MHSSGVQRSGAHSPDAALRRAGVKHGRLSALQTMCSSASRELAWAARGPLAAVHRVAGISRSASGTGAWLHAGAATRMAADGPYVCLLCAALARPARTLGPGGWQPGWQRAACPAAHHSPHPKPPGSKASRLSGLSRPGSMAAASWQHGSCNPQRRHCGAAPGPPWATEPNPVHLGLAHIPARTRSRHSVPPETPGGRPRAQGASARDHLATHPRLQGRGRGEGRGKRWQDEGRGAKAGRHGRAAGQPQHGWWLLRAAHSYPG